MESLQGVLLMAKEWTVAELIAFEDDIKQEYSQGKIRAPIHLSGGNEKTLIGIFEGIKDNDWVFSTHRCHYHALLKGIPKEEVKKQIMTGHSMHIASQKHRFMTSSIVGGCLPIAVGVAMAIKRLKSDEKVWCFVGDMAAETGVFEECIKYAQRNELPITFVVEDNGLSTNSPTQELWGLPPYPEIKCVIRYDYTRTHPHIGVGHWVEFR